MFRLSVGLHQFGSVKHPSSFSFFRRSGGSVLSSRKRVSLTVQFSIRRLCSGPPRSQKEERGGPEHDATSHSGFFSKSQKTSISMRSGLKVERYPSGQQRSQEVEVVDGKKLRSVGNHLCG